MGKSIFAMRNVCSFCLEMKYIVELSNHEDACMDCIQKAIDEAKENERIDHWIHMNLRGE